MLQKFEVHGLSEKEIRPDGHCLYSAFADQLEELGMALEPATVPNGVEGRRDEMPGYSRVRIVAARFISEHPDDFIPFLEEPLNEYVHKIHDTAEWGGQLELLALARAYGVQINVLQGDGRIVSVGSGESTCDGREIWLAYYRHSFGLGEHYNSLRKRK
jgi:OTU domain-containing protein 6